MDTLLFAPRSAADEVAGNFAIKARYNSFWDAYNRESKLLSEDSLLCDLASKDLNFMMANRIDVMTIPSFNELLRKSEQVVRAIEPVVCEQFVARNAVRAGSVQKADQLTKFIEKTVVMDPKLSTEELISLLVKLGKNEGFEVDRRNAQNRSIRWEERGRSKSAPVSGLKHRVSRAKKNKVSC